MGRVSVGEVVDALLDRFPASRAEPWDRVGLVLGDPSRSAEHVCLALDADASAIDAATSAGCGLLVTHHPPFIETPRDLVTASLGAAYGALREGLAIASLHTNLDRSPSGREALPERLGIPADEVLESAPEPVGHVVAHVPEEAADTVRDAMLRAGGGRLGEYDGCSFETTGSGRFEPRGGADPHVEGGVSEERRVEVWCAPGDADRVAAAAARAHPYEEPLVYHREVGRARGRIGLGSVGDLDRRTTLEEFGDLVAERLGAPVEVWGEGASMVRRVACAGGSGGSLAGDALRAGADCLVTGEVRYHDAVEASERGLALLVAGHDATEMPLVGVLDGEIRRLFDDRTRTHVHEAPPRRRVLHGRSA